MVITVATVTEAMAAVVEDVVGAVYGDGVADTRCMTSTW
jgi:hypothetical protein